MNAPVRLALAALLLGGAVAWAGEASPPQRVNFSAKPTAAKNGDKIKISFTVSAPTDVEVAVLDSAGKVVRHLAAGVLGGEKDPPAPLAKGLAQTVEWDGKDDAGKPAMGAAKVRVRAGTSARFGKLLGFDPYRMTIIKGLASDEKGRVYVLYSPFHGGGESDIIRQFGADGKYLKTVWPPPADLTAEQSKGLPKVTGPATDADRLYPANYQPLLPKFLPPNADIAMLGHRVRGGKLLLTSIGEGFKFMSVNADGSVPTPLVLGRLLPAWGETANPPRAGGGGWLGLGAVSPDGKTVYMSSLQVGKPADIWKNGAILSVDLTAPLTPVVAGWQKSPTLGLLALKSLAEVTVPSGAKLHEQPYNDWGAKMGMATVHGLDVDDAGNVYACDRANNCIAVFDKDGKALGTVKVTDPDQVAVHPKTGAIYVLTRSWKDKGSALASLVKLSALKDGGKELARFAFDQPARKAPLLALDSSTETPGLWVSCIGSQGGLVKLADRGGSFEKAVDLGTKRTPEGMDCIWLTWTNPVTDEVFAADGWGGDKWGAGRPAWRFEGKTGKRLPCDFSALDMAFDLQGNVYYSGFKAYTTPAWRLTPDLKPLPFPGSDKNVTAGRDIYGKYGWAQCQKGLCVARDGGLYAFHMKTWSEYTVVRWTPDGKAVDGFVTGSFMNTRSGGLKIDAAGNLYVGVPGWPKSHTLPYSSPAFFSGASVVKFKPSPDSTDAGKTRPAEAMDWQGPRCSPWLAGALAAYPHQSPNGASGDHLGCTCKEARFDLDLYGRLYIPNALTYRVTVVDNSGNVILKAGHYGNADSQGPGTDSPLKTPEIPLGWPMTVGAAPDHGHVYAGDVVNNRIVRIDLVHAAEEACDAR
jgi:hypothetical protein